MIPIKKLKSYILLIYSGRISIPIPKELEKSKPEPKQEWNAAQQTPNPVVSCPASRVCGDNIWAPTTTIHMNSLQGLWTVRHFLVSLAFSWKLSTSLHDTVTLALCGWCYQVLWLAQDVSRTPLISAALGLCMSTQILLESIVNCLWNISLRHPPPHTQTPPHSAFKSISIFMTWSLLWLRSYPQDPCPIVPVLHDANL